MKGGANTTNGPQGNSGSCAGNNSLLIQHQFACCCIYCLAGDCGQAL